MAAEQETAGKPVPQLRREQKPGQDVVEQALLNPKPEEVVRETSIPAREFRETVASQQIKKEAEESLTLHWGSEWHHFPKDRQSFQDGWGSPRTTECSPWGHSEASSPHFQKTSNISQRPGGEQAAQLQLGSERDAQGMDSRPLAKDESDCGRAEAKTILEEETISTEVHRQRFRRFCYLEAEGPREVCNQLWFLCYQWLKPEQRSKEQILELLILEQFMSILPPETQGWVKEHGPETCAQAVALAEDYLLKQEEAMETDHGASESLRAQEGSLRSLLPLQRMEKVVSGLLAEVALYSSKTKRTKLDRNDKRENQKHVPLADEEQTRENRTILEQQSSKEEELSKRKSGDFGLSPETAERNQVPPGLKPHKCSECGKRFHQISHLNRHLRIHTGEKPYKCLDCGKSFTQGSCLLGHQRIHTGEKAYSCSYCSKSFIWSSGLHQHEKIHLGEKPYKCLECGKSFHRSSALTDHVRSHTGEKPYTCSDCGKGFSQHSNLIVHRRVHTGEKPYTCSICGKSFTRTALLMAHLRIHTGEKPYKCLVCERSFRERPALTKHKKIHMRENL